jgi:Bacterial Ig domain
LNVDVGNYAPVAVIDKNRVTVLSGTSVAASASLSYDEDGDNLTYSWAVDARPSGSTATIAAPASVNLAFTPDKPGLYAISVTVNDGRASNVAYVNIRALSSVSGSVALNFVPLSAQYSKGLDKLILISANPNALRIVDPFVGSTKQVVLPWSVKGWHLSPNGKLAALLHEGQVSLVDLEAATLVRTSLTSGSQTDVFVQNDAIAYLIGQTGGQWVTPPITILNTRTGEALSSPGWLGGGGYFYGTQKGIFADRKNRVLFMAYGLSPSDISYFTIDPVAHTILTAGDSPYHGNYSLGDTFYLSGNQDLVFTSIGTYFLTETLSYAGALQIGTGAIQSMSHSSSIDEALVLQMSWTGSNYPSTPVYNPYYKRFYGALFLEDADIPLPQIGGQQSYGIQIFHSANDEHVVLVQTGSDVALDSAAQYHVIYR